MKIHLTSPVAISDLAVMAGGQLVSYGISERVGITHICTDSREADVNTLFCAIRGERVDGHNYMAKAAELGCAVFLCERIPDPLPVPSCAFIVVADTVDALSALALSRREAEMRDLSVVAITGSVGKTTTKEMTAAVLEQGLTLFRKEGNYNSTIGLPLSFMEIPTDTECAVLEMGMSSRGEIATMSQAVRPNIAVVTNIGSSHLEYLGTRKNIARAKLEIASGLSAGGVLLINGEEPLLGRLGQNFGEDLPVIPEGIRVLRVALTPTPDVDYLASSISPHTRGMEFSLTTPDGDWPRLYVPALGEHIVWAAAFAAAVGHLNGLTEEQVREGLASYRPAHMRQSMRTMGGVTVIEDCYNAAPESMKAALDVLVMAVSSASNGRCIAVLGDMKELGDNGVALHRAVGRYVVTKGVDLLITVGELGAEIAKGAQEAGMDPTAITVTGGMDTYAETADYLKRILREGDRILFKASRSMRLETMIEAVFGPSEQA
jgi:UDP-N-acetylmuramoyl-tripeptide--D-alanyl-D-alanine ligase